MTNEERAREIVEQFKKEDGWDSCESILRHAFRKYEERIENANAIAEERGTTLNRLAEQKWTLEAALKTAKMRIDELRKALENSASSLRMENCPTCTSLYYAHFDFCKFGKTIKAIEEALAKDDEAVR
jgi:hypothetical protein